MHGVPILRTWGSPPPTHTHTWHMAHMPQVLERVFVDARHGASGFYLLRFFHDDPRSDDDWKVTTLTLTLAPTLALPLALPLPLTHLNPN